MPKLKPPAPPQGAGTFAAGTPVVVPPGMMLIAFASPGFTASLSGIMKKTPVGTQSVPYPSFQGVGYSQRFTNQVFNQVTPSVADANINWFLWPDGLPLPFETPGKTATTIQDASGFNVPNATPTAIYTCPANSKAWLLRGNVQNPNSGSAGTFFLAQKLTAGGFISDWITALAGFPMAAGPSNYNFGTMPGCDILFSGTARPLVPGDILLANVTGATGNVSVSYEILVEPL